MSQELKLKIKGLYSHPNHFSEVPEGALIAADNIVIDRESIAETRRGFKRYGVLSDPYSGHWGMFPWGSIAWGSSIGAANKLFSYRGSLVSHYGYRLYYDSDDNGTFIAYTGTFPPPEVDYQVRAIEANNSFYFTTSAGIKKLTSLTGTPTMAGMYKALDGSGVTSGASGWMPDTTNAAYRVVWGIKDENEYLVLGAPSQRIIVTNTSGGTRDIDLTFTIPDGITTDHFYQVYRSAETVSVADEPSDEMQLVIEDFPTAGEITAKVITVTDSTPNSLKGAFLYTSPTQEGISQANEVPPFCKDMTVFRDCVLMANTRQKHRLYLTMIGPGFIVNDTVTIAGTVYTAKAAESIANKQFQIFSGGTPAENIEDTCNSLVRVINRNTTNDDVYAFYISGYADLPGQILIEERGIGGASFAATASTAGVGALFSPALPTTGTTVSSTNDENVHRVCMAKFKQPDAAPLLQFLDCGSADQPIKRILALRDATFVLKDDGIFRIGGDDINTFRVTMFDNTTQLLARESAVVFDSKIYAFTDMGIVTISDTGVEVISRQIEKTLLEITPMTNFGNVTHAIGYESERKYILYTVSSDTDTYPTQAFVYNTATSSWTRWTNTAVTGTVRSRDNKLYLIHGTNSYVYKERKTYSLSDYADEEFAVSITGSLGTTVSLASTSDCVAGQTLKQAGFTSVIETVVNITTLTVRDDKAWSVAAATVYDPIAVTLEFVEINGGNPVLVKHFSEVTFLFSEAAFRRISLGFASNFKGTFAYTEALVGSFKPWGLFTWGDPAIPWGATVGGFRAIRVLVPREYCRNLWLYVRVELEEALKNIGFNGCGVLFDVISPRIK